MLKGQLDVVRPTSAAGWAADTEFPEAAAEIILFVDGTCVAWLSCTLPRPDLQEVIGGENHGFLFHFDPPLPTHRPVRVTARFAKTGAVLVNGDVQTSPDASVVFPAIHPKDLERRRKLPPPRHPRQMLDALSIHDVRYDLYDLLNQIDFEGFSESGLWRSLLGGAFPAQETEMVRLSEPHARHLAYEMLTSQEFRAGIVRHMLECCPEKRRRIFLHIPKCAGSDLSAHLVRRMPAIDHRWAESSWISNSVLFAQLGEFARHLPFFSDVFVHGHAHLSYYMENLLIRPTDHAFTVIRDPLEVALSQVNYVLTRINEAALDRSLLGPDVEEWLSFLEINSPPPIDSGLARELKSRILLNPEIVHHNPIAHWLGGKTWEEVLSRLEVNNVEVSTKDTYSSWLAERWKIRSKTKVNASVPFLSKDDLSDQELEYILSITDLDRATFGQITNLIQKLGSASVVWGKRLWT